MRLDDDDRENFSFTLFSFIFCLFFLYYVQFCICRFKIKSTPKIQYDPCKRGKEGYWYLSEHACYLPADSTSPKMSYHGAVRIN